MTLKVFILSSGDKGSKRKKGQVNWGMFNNVLVVSVAGGAVQYWQ